ncbi:hypothetical protein [Veronia pacifica]|uniref:Uncharacterized protein n=1 Tax=Veronia pacifica TaxID=1080227 RepID=A0A1C3EPR2_9GAMM|nr:hypothetical protein [Veronia pacifica]ODA35248.1 hypothetical protein A8L45_04875 [Veronia pacifica]
MFFSLGLAIAAGVIGAQWVLTLVLLRGDICPGQRGRIHGVFWYLVGGWLLVIPALPWAVLPFLVLGIFAFRAKTGKTRQVGPIPLLHLANGLGLLTLFMFLIQGQWLQNILILLQLPILGAAFSHCLLVKARSRLQAFHRILPVVGICVAMLMAVAGALVGYVSGAGEAEMLPILASLALLLTGVTFWIVHLFRQDAPKLVMLVPALSAVTGSSFLLNSLI